MKQPRLPSISNLKILLLLLLFLLLIIIIIIFIVLIDILIHNNIPLKYIIKSNVT